MTITFISDTHGKHNQVDLCGGDVLIHAGDIEARNEWSLRHFLEWFEGQDYKYKVFVAGNHDFYLQRPDAYKVVDLYQVEYLQDSIVTIDDVTIWGSPWSLPFMDWAFMLPEEKLEKRYPNRDTFDIDIFVNHGAPKNILDSFNGIVTGSQSLADSIQDVKPDYAVFGHIHECYGQKEVDGTKYMNCSLLDENYDMVNEPVTIDI